jgi:hypothetical protein
MNDEQSPSNILPKHLFFKAECSHEHYHLNARGTSHNADGTVTIRHHWWCDECQTGFHDDQTMPAAEYWQLVREGEID